jgi:hypothetical protein
LESPAHNNNVKSQGQDHLNPPSGRQNGTDIDDVAASGSGEVTRVTPSSVKGPDFLTARQVRGKRRRFKGSLQNPQNCVKGHTKVSPKRIPQSCARSKISYNIAAGEKRVGGALWDAAFGCQRTMEHYRNMGWLSSWVVADQTVT